MPEETYTDLAIKRQAMLERLKSGQVKDFGKEINKVDDLVRRAIGASGDDLSALSRSRLEELIKDLRSDQGAIFKAATAKFLENAGDIAFLYGTQEELDLVKTTTVVGTQLEKFSKKRLLSNVLARPLTTAGFLLEPWVKQFTDKAIEEVSGSIRNGYNQGLTNRQITKAVVGTKGTNFRGSTLAKIKRNASTVVRTSVQHVASAARQEVWEKNGDIIERYQFLATLDGSTSQICRSLDLKEFELEKGPIPPLHPNCRSTTIPVISGKYRFLTEGEKRSSPTGPVDGDKSYYEWLKGQSPTVQKQVLGKKRAALFQTMDAKKFSALQFDKTWTPLTLGEMQKLEPAAFKKAGIFKKAPGVAPKAAPKVTSKRAKELARREKVPMAQELLDLEAAGWDLGDNITFLNLLPKNANFPLRFTFPTDGSGKKARFQKLEKGGEVMIEVNDRFSKEKGTFASVFAHETGHAIDVAWGWTQTKFGRKFNQKTNKFEIFKKADPNPIFLTAWEKAKKIISKNGKAGNMEKYGRPQNSEYGRPVWKRVGEAEKSKLFGPTEREENIWGEQEFALSDTIMALTNSRYGGGHKVSYMKNRGAKETEFMAHAFENYFVGNPAFKLHEPELYKVMTDMVEELIEETNKINK